MVSLALGSSSPCVLVDITRERLEIVWKANDVLSKNCAKLVVTSGSGWNLWHLLPVKSGRHGRQAYYQMAIALRAVTISNATTAGVGDLPLFFLARVAAAHIV